MPSYMEINTMLTAGRKSVSFKQLMEYNIDNILTEEQIAIMSLICDNASTCTEHSRMDFVHEVIATQNLMPGDGKIISRQILCLIARMVDIE